MKDLFSGEDIAPKNTTTSSVPLDIEFEPNDPATMQGNITSVHPEENEAKAFEYGLKPEPYHAGIIETAKATFQSTSSLANVNDYLNTQRQNSNPLDDITDPNWKPTDNPSLFSNTDVKYKSYLMSATSQKDQERRYSQVMDWQDRDKLIKNGSSLGWLIGGFGGMSPLGSPEMLIPIAGQVKYARYAPTILNSVARALPGIAASSVAHEATLNATKASGNLEDFVVDSFADIVFGAAFVGGGALIGRAIDSGALWDMRKLINPMYKGIDFKLKVTEEGKIAGYQAFDSTGSLSAADVNYAQDLANSTFAKTGLFKIPYLGEGASKTFGVFSPVMRMMNSPYQTVRAFTDRVANHPFITEGILKGIPAPQKFENEMDKVKGGMRLFAAQMDGLHLVRNGIDISSKSRARIQSTSYLKDLKGKLTPENYTSVDQFHEEIDQTVRSGTSSPHAAVNEAAGMIRNILDETYTAWRKAYNLPETWLPPRTAQEYLMRVYNTPYMDLKQNEWTEVVSSWLKEADDTINGHMQPIRDLEDAISIHKEKHSELISRTNITDEQIKSSINKLKTFQVRKKALEEQLQNELRTNEDLRIHIDDPSAVSADEAKQIIQLTKKRDIALKEVNERKKIISDIQKQIKKREASAAKGKTVKTAKSNTRKSETGKLVLEQEQQKLDLAQREYEEQVELLNEQMHNGTIDRNLFKESEVGNYQYEFKDPNNRLKFRDTYRDGPKEDPNYFRKEAAKAHYNTIMNQTPEQLSGQIMGRIVGGDRINSLKERSLLIPDKVISPFLSKNIVHNVTNYKYFLSRRTFLKNVFNDVSVDGGIEPLIKSLSDEHNSKRSIFNENLDRINKETAKLKEKLKQADTEEKRESINKKLRTLASEQKQTDKAIIKQSKQLKEAVEQMQITYSKMMGTRVFGKRATKYLNMIMSYTAAVKLGFVPFTMITDLSANILQHGLWPFIRDGIVPAIESLGGTLKTKDSEALRRAAPHVNLALQDVLTGYADKNFGGQAQPYINMGSKVANGLEGLAHFSSNFTGTNYIDNGLQHLTGSIAQSTFMEYMYAFKNGTLSKGDQIKLLQYGLDPKVWADRFIAQFEKAGAHKTKLGGYNSNFWLWDDLEASNKFGDAVFRGVKDTVVQRGMLDAPFFMDHPLGAVIMSFKGWTFASLNRYVIPAMQKANAEKLIGISFMLAAGALVSPTRRIASGQDPYPDDVTEGQIMYAAMQDSGFFSIFGDILSDMNVLSGGTLLGNLHNDRYRDRTLAGVLGASAGMSADMYSIIGSILSGEFNKNDANKMARLLPLTQTTEFRALTNKAVDSLDIPKTRAQAQRMNLAEG